MALGPCLNGFGESTKFFGRWRRNRAPVWDFCRAGMDALTISTKPNNCGGWLSVTTTFRVRPTGINFRRDGIVGFPKASPASCGASGSTRSLAKHLGNLSGTSAWNKIPFRWNRELPKSSQASCGAFGSIRNLAKRLGKLFLTAGWNKITRRWNREGAATLTVVRQASITVRNV